MITTVDIAWPESTVPLPTYEVSGKPRNASIASEASSPRIDRRSRFTTSCEQLQVNWVLNAAQFTAFEEFFLDTLGNGVSCFSMDLRYPKTSELSSWLVRFEGGYQTTKLDGPSQVEATLVLVQLLEIADAAS